MKDHRTGAGAWARRSHAISPRKKHEVTLWIFSRNGPVDPPDGTQRALSAGHRAAAEPAGPRLSHQGIAGAELVVVASVSKGFRNVTKCWRIRRHRRRVTKGINVNRTW